jgi:NADH-quinone oxidoreductase subunit F
VLRHHTPKTLAQLVLDSGLQGRGGAGFPTGRKWMSVPDDAGFPRYVVVNTDEMEPGTFKDRLLVASDPHQLIEGTILAGYAISGQRGILFVRPSYELNSQILERELAVARDAGFLGEHILGTDFSFDITVHRSGGRYICGEGIAQIHAIAGNRPHPLKLPVFQTIRGLWDLPTLGNNVETLACVPHIIRHGPQWFRNLARTETASGTKLYCVSGRVNRPACVELPMGVRLSELIEEYAGGIKSGSKFKACMPGGSSTRFLPAQFYDIELDFESMKKVGHRLGTASIIVYADDTCLVASTLNIIRFFARESCGWCTPCREGLPYIQDLLERIEAGHGKEEYIPRLRQMAEQLNHSYCAFAPGAACSVESLLTYFEDEVLEHISQRKCPFRK